MASYRKPEQRPWPYVPEWFAEAEELGPEKKAYCYLKEGYTKFPKCCLHQAFGDLLNHSLK